MVGTGEDRRQRIMNLKDKKERRIYLQEKMENMKANSVKLKL